MQESKKRPGPAPKPPEAVRSVRVTTLLTPPESDTVTLAARLSGKPLVQYRRLALLEHSTQVIQRQHRHD